MSDLISRQAAIDAIRGWVNKAFEDWGNATTEIQCFNAIYPLIMALPSAQPDLDSAYTEGYTAAESKYRKMWDEMQANIKEKAFGKRKGLVHTADIDAMPTIEERKTGKWVGIKEYCDHLNEEAEREGKGNRYLPSGMNIRVYCNQCWEPNDRRTTYCPNCGARLVQEGEDNDRA